MDPAYREEIRIPAVLGSEKDVRERAASFAGAAGFGKERIEDIKTAVSEAVLNAIEHGVSSNAAETVLIRLFRETDGMSVEVASRGKPFSLPDAKPDIGAKIKGTDRPRGWGLYFMKQLADRVSVSYEGGVTRTAMKFLL